MKRYRLLVIALLTGLLAHCIISEPMQKMTVDRYPIRIGKRYGYINAEGEVVIPAKFYRVNWFNENRAVVELEPGKKVLIDKQGNIVFQDTSGYLRDVFSEGLIRFDRKDGTSCFLDSLGKARFCLSDTIVEADAFFTNERLRVRYAGRRFAFLDTQGKVAFELDRGFPAAFYDGLTTVQFSGRTCYLNNQGRRQFCIRDRGKNFSDGLALVTNGKTTYFINKKGKPRLTNLHYDAVTPFVNGHATVMKGENKGFINTKGREVIPVRYKEVLFFNSDLVAVKSKGKGWIFLNAQNEQPIQQTFDEVATPGFIGELAYVRQGNSRGYINKQGRLVWQEK